MRLDGTVRWINARGQFYYGANGDAVRMLGMAVDITERKLAEQVLREGEERFRVVANTAPVMIWMSGTDKLRTYVNQSWLEFTGRPLEAELGNGWVESVHPEDLNSVCRPTLRRSIGGSPSRWSIGSGDTMENIDGFRTPACRDSTRTTLLRDT